MKTFNKKYWNYLLGIIACAFLAFHVPVDAGVTKKAKKDINSYFENAPWIGLIADTIDYGPLQISQVYIHDDSKLAIVAPGEEIKGSLKYRIKAEDLDSMHLYHLVIGIKGEGAQDCVTHTLGVWDSKGRGNFKLKAPEKAGVYQVRFLFVNGLTCSGARDMWNTEKDTPSSAATIGVIIVE